MISEARYTEVMQFILDPVSIPFILCIMQAHGDEANQLLFHMTQDAPLSSAPPEAVNSVPTTGLLYLACFLLIVMLENVQLLY